MPPYEDHESTVVLPDGTVFKSRNASAIANAVRWVLSRERVCVCPPRECVVEDDGRCFRCSGRVVPRAPFRAGEWP